MQYKNTVRKAKSVKQPGDNFNTKTQPNYFRQIDVPRGTFAYATPYV